MPQLWVPQPAQSLVVSHMLCSSELLCLVWQSLSKALVDVHAHADAMNQDEDVHLQGQTRLQTALTGQHQE